MRRRDLLCLFLVALTVRLAVAAFIPRPGYMDAAYYASGTERLALDPFTSTSLVQAAGSKQAPNLWRARPIATNQPGMFCACEALPETSEVLSLQVLLLRQTEVTT